MSLNRLRATVAFCSTAAIGLGVCAAAWAQPSPNVNLPILDSPCQARKYTCGENDTVQSITLKGRMEHNQVDSVTINRLDSNVTFRSDGVVQCRNGTLFLSYESGELYIDQSPGAPPVEYPELGLNPDAVETCR